MIDKIQLPAMQLEIARTLGVLRASAAWRLRRAQQQEKGQALLEFAFSLMILLTLTFGMIDFSRAVYTLSVVQAAAQAGARAGLVDLTTVNAAVQQKLIGLDTSKAQITTTVLNSEQVQVQITYQFQFMTPFIAQLVPNGRLDLHGSASMLID